MSKKAKQAPQRIYSRWFRFYSEALHDPKIVTLTDRQFRSWVGILTMASVNNGTMPTNRDVASHLRLSQKDTEDQINDLIEMGLIDICPDGSMTPHNWSKRQYSGDGKTSSERVKKHRLKQQCNGDVTLHETECNVSASVVCSLESVTTSEGRILSTSLSAPTKDPGMKDRNTKGGRKRDASLSSSDEHEAVAIDSGSFGRARDVSGGRK